MIPDKCLSCEHTIIRLEDVHKGWCKFQMEPVVRCDLSPVKYRVGCVCAEIYCDRRKGEPNEVN